MPQSEYRIAYSDNHALIHGELLSTLLLMFDPFQVGMFLSFERRADYFIRLIPYLHGVNPSPMLRFRVKSQAEDEPPRTLERQGQVAVEAVLDTGEGFKLTSYLDLNGDWSVRIQSTDLPSAGQQILYAGNWKVAGRNLEVIS